MLRQEVDLSPAAAANASRKEGDCNQSVVCPLRVGLRNACCSRLNEASRGEFSFDATAVTTLRVSMNRWIAVITSLHVLVHGIFGCCGHGMTASRMADPCHCQHAHHDAHADSLNDPHHDHADHGSPSQAPHECVHASCHWLLSDVSPRVGGLDFFGAAQLAALLPTAAPLTSVAQFSPGDIFGPASAPPLRLHLVLSVLLI
jgi:hypothetical protein